MNNGDQNPQNTQNPEKQTEQQNPDQGSAVTFSDEQQAAINELISKQVAKERQRAEQQAQEAAKQAEKDKQAAVDKAIKREKMSADERAEAERKDREQALEKKQADLDQAMREFQTKNLLLDKGVSTDMLPLVMGANDDETSQRLELLKKYTDEKVQKATEELLRGSKSPASGNNGFSGVVGKNPWSKNDWNLTEQQNILSTNPEQAQQMIAQAQPKGFFFK